MEHLYFVVHSHWDREWYQPFQRMRARLLTMMDKMLAQLESGALPCFHFDGQTIVLEDYLEVRPDSARRIAKLVKAGKLQIGPWYLLADSFLASGEALIRNLEIGSRIARRFGKCAETGYLPDQFGHAAQLPQILSGFGLKAGVVFRGVGREVKRNRFIWEALDGSSTFMVFLPFGYSNGASLPTDSADATIARVSEIAAREREFSAGAPILVMNGNDHAEPDAAVFARLKEAAGRAPFSTEVGTLDDYVKRLSELPARRHAARPRRIAIAGALESHARRQLVARVDQAARLSEFVSARADCRSADRARRAFERCRRPDRAARGCVAHRDSEPSARLDLRMLDRPGPPGHALPLRSGRDDRGDRCATRSKCGAIDGQMAARPRSRCSIRPSPAARSSPARLKSRTRTRAMSRSMMKGAGFPSRSTSRGWRGRSRSS